MRKTVLLLASMALAVLLATGVALAAAGDLDPSFGEGGKVLLAQNADVQDIAVQRADGKIVVAGSSGNRFSGGNFLLMRLLPTGTPDESFGGGDGVVTTDLDTPLNTPYAIANDVLVQPDGKIVAAGYAGSGSWTQTLALVRYKPDGTIDRSFGGGDGKVLTKPRGVHATAAEAVLRQPNDKLVVAGYANPERGDNSDSRHVLLVRYFADGRLDKSFGGGDGFVLSKFRGRAFDVDRQNNGKLVVGGDNYGEYDFESQFMFLRRLPDGSPDKSFSSDGKRFVAVRDRGWGEFQDVRALILRPDGKIVGAGGAYYQDILADAYGGVALVRLEPNGVLDKDFGGGDGKVLGGMTPFGAYDLLRQQDGKLIVVGTHEVRDCDDGCTTTAQTFALRRYNPNGNLDASFGSGGEVLTSFPSSFSSAYAGALQADGKVVAAGSANGIALVRYLTE